MIGLCRGRIALWAVSSFRRNIMSAEARCQVNRGINALIFCKLEKDCDSFRFLKLFCVHFCWEGTAAFPGLMDRKKCDIME